MGRRMTRPQRHRKADTLTNPGATAAEIRTDFATGPFDRMARQMDALWGHDRLPELVSPESAERWGKAMANLNAAIAAQDSELVASRVAACLRGFAALDAEARALGHQPTPPTAWRFDLDGQACAITKDAGDWTQLRAAMPDVRLYTLLEVANALRQYGASVAAVKDSFPGAQVAAVRTPSPLEAELNDSIPF